MNYYTPELEEFHIGFEYEAYEEGYEYKVKLVKEQPEIELQVLSEPVQVVGWVKHTYQLDDFITLIDGEISTYVPEVRVKYLDEQDIKDLGWKIVGDSPSPFTGKSLMTYKIVNEVGFNTGKDCYLVTTDTNQIEISIFEYSSYGGSESKLLFDIKNKSELKRLMKQLGIIT